MDVHDLSGEARWRLLRLARHSIESHLGGPLFALAEADPAAPGASPELTQKRGAFVTLRQRADGRLRGCVGRVESEESLADTVAQVAVAAATADRRFRPITIGELPALSVEVSALHAAGPIEPEQVVVGLHGLILRFGGRSGLLLPQVALEHGWNRDLFLEGVCRKAGLPTDTWRQPGCNLLGFTATVFGES